MEAALLASADESSFSISAALQMLQVLEAEGHDLQAPHSALRSASDHRRTPTGASVASEGRHEEPYLGGQPSLFPALTHGFDPASIDHLNWSCVNLRDAGAEWLSRQLPLCHNLFTMDLSGNAMREKGALALASVLPLLRGLRFLDLSCNNLCNPGAVGIAKCLPDCRPLKDLRLSYNHIGQSGAQALAQALLHSGLEVLHLANNGIRDEGAKAMATALHHNRTLQVLVLNGNFIKDGIRSLAHALTFNHTLKRLSVGDNYLHDDGMQALCLALQAPKHDLDSPHGLTQEGSVRQSGLHELNLFYNHTITELAAQRLSKAIQSPHCYLTWLDLAGNFLGDEGATAIASALSLPTCTIQRLHLCSNYIGEVGGKSLASAIAINASISEVKLVGNAIGDEGAKAWAQAFHTNRTCESVNLFDNGIEPPGIQALAHAIQNHNRVLCVVSVDVVGAVYEASAEALETALRANRLRRDLVRSTALQVLRAARLLLLALPRRSCSLSVLPREIQERIVAALDGRHLLTDAQLAAIFRYAANRSTLPLADRGRMSFWSSVQCLKYAKRH